MTSMLNTPAGNWLWCGSHCVSDMCPDQACELYHILCSGGVCCNHCLNFCAFSCADSGATWYIILDASRKYVAIALDNTGTSIIALSSTDKTAVYRGNTTNRITWTWTDISNGFAFSKNDVWLAAACSGDGTKLLLSKAGGQTLYTGSLSNTTRTWSWTQAAVQGTWTSVAVSKAGTAMAAVQFGGDIMFSSDGGSTFAPMTGTNYPGPSDYYSVAMNGDGTQLLVAQASPPLHNKQQLGLGILWLGRFAANTWTWSTTGPTGTLLGGDFITVASSRDGNTLVAARALLSGVAGAIYISSDGGATWSRDASLLLRDWTAVAVAR